MAPNEDKMTETRYRPKPTREMVGAGEATGLAQSSDLGNNRAEGHAPITIQG